MAGEFSTGGFILQLLIFLASKDAFFDPELLHLSGAMTAQSVVKHFLTEGDKLLISRLSPLEDQGGYAIASNYGALRSGNVQGCQLTAMQVRSSQESYSNP
jgi:hypothetical protein